MALKRPQRNQKKQMKPNQSVFFLGGKRKWMPKIFSGCFMPAKRMIFFWLKMRYSDFSQKILTFLQFFRRSLIKLKRTANRPTVLSS